MTPNCGVIWLGWLFDRRMTPALRWRYNGHDSVSNHQPHDCLLNLLFRRRSKKISKLHVTGLCAWNSPGTGEFPAQMASNAENVSIWWRHHADANFAREYRGYIRLFDRYKTCHKYLTDSRYGYKRLIPVHHIKFCLNIVQLHWLDRCRILEFQSQVPWSFTKFYINIHIFHLYVCIYTYVYIYIFKHLVSMITVYICFPVPVKWFWRLWVKL